MELGCGKPTQQDSAQVGVSLGNSLERSTEGRIPATEITSSSSTKPMDPNDVLAQPPQCDQGLKLGTGTRRLASSLPSTDAEKFTLSTSSRVQGPATEANSSHIGSIALNPSKDKAVPLVLIKQGSPSEKLLVYAHAATGATFQGGIPLNLKKASIGQTNVTSAEKGMNVPGSSNMETKDLGGNSKPSCSLPPHDSNSGDTDLATLPEVSQSKEVPANPLHCLHMAKETDECFLGRLGLKKVEEPLRASTKSEDPVKGEEAGEAGSGRGVDQQRLGDKSEPGDDRISEEELLVERDIPVTGTPGQALRPQNQPSNQIPQGVAVAASKAPTIKVISPMGDTNSVAEVDISGLQNVLSKDGSASSDPSSSTATGIGKNTPIYIKVKLEEKDVTVICCPVALLLQHKEMLNVTIQADNPNAYSITCRKCLHQVSEACAMLQHLKAQHQIQGCLQKLLNLNSQHLGCMSKPVCVNIPGVLTLPDGLSDMEQGVIRFNNLGIPRLSFVCRLCPLNFHTARGLSSHHQYFMRSIYNMSHHSVANSRWFCRLCPLQFSNFQDYYAHHKWMRVAKDLFVNTEHVSKKKFQVMDESGKVVASVEVPKSHSLTIKTWPAPNSDPNDGIGWGRKPSLLDDGSPLGRLDPLIPDMTEDAFEAQVMVLNSAIPFTTAEGMGEADKDKKTAPPLFQTLDSLCRRLAQRVDSSSTGSDKQVPIGDKQVDDDHEYMCGICHKTFPRLPQMQGHMGSHVRKRRSNRNAPPVPATVSVPPPDPPCAEQPKAVELVDVEYKCGVCHETFPKLDQMQIHSECHNRSHPATRKPMKSLDTPFLETLKLMSFTCDICQRSFPAENKLWDHRRTHNQKKSDEGTNISSHSSHDVHRKTLFVCLYCKKSFARQVNLKFHLKKHGTDKPLQGSNRGSTRTSLTGKEGLGGVNSSAYDNPDLKSQHACSICDRAFHSQRQLKSHKAWHAKGQGASHDPPAAVMEMGRASQNLYSCSKCDVICSSFGELHNHNKQHATSRRLLVRHSSDDEDSSHVKKRTPAWRGCKGKKHKDASDSDASRKKKKGRPSKRKTEGLFKYFCRTCRSYFRSSHQFARHMAVHSNSPSSNSRSSSDSSPGGNRHADISNEPTGKQTAVDVHADESSIGTNMTRSTSPDATDGQPSVISKVGPETVEDLLAEEVREAAKNCEVHKDSSLAVEVTSQTLETSGADEQSPQASDQSAEAAHLNPVGNSTTRAEMEDAMEGNSSDGESCQKQHEACFVDSKYCKETSPILIDSNDDAGLNETVSCVENNCSARRNSPAEIVRKEEKEITQRSSPTNEAIPCDNTKVVMVGMCHETRPGTPVKQPLENCEAHAVGEDQHMTNISTQSADCDPVVIKTESEASPTMSEENVPRSDEPMEIENTHSTDQTTVCLSIEEKLTKTELGSSVNDATSCKSLSGVNETLNLNKSLTHKQQDDQLLHQIKHEKETCSEMGTGSQETRQSIADEPLCLLVTDRQLTTPPTLEPSTLEESSTVMHTGRQGTGPGMPEIPMLMSKVKRPNEDSFAMERQETRPVSSDATPSASKSVVPDENFSAAMDSDSQESEGSILDVPPTLNCEVHPQTGSEFTLKDDNEPGAPAKPDEPDCTHGSNSTLVLEDTKIPTIQNSAELHYSQTETEKSSGISQKLLQDSTIGDSAQSCKVPDSDFADSHSAGSDDLHAAPEDGHQGTNQCTFETQTQEKESAQPETVEDKTQQRDDGTQLKPQVASDPTIRASVVSSDGLDSVAVDRGPEPKCFTRDIKLLRSCEVPTLKADGKSTDSSTACDASAGGVVRANREALLCSPDAHFAETEMEELNTSELCEQKKSYKLTRAITPTANSDVVQQANPTNLSPLLESLPQTKNTSPDNPKDVEVTKAAKDCEDSAVIRKVSGATIRPSVFEALTQNITKPSEAPAQLPVGMIFTVSQGGSSSALVEAGREAGPGELPDEKQGISVFPKILQRYTCDVCNKSFPKKSQLRGHKASHSRYPMEQESNEENSDNAVEGRGDEPEESTGRAGDELQEKTANDFPANTTEAVDPQAEVINANRQMSICDAEVAPNFRSGASLTQSSEKQSQLVHSNSRIGDDSTTSSASVSEEVRKTASGANIEKPARRDNAEKQPFSCPHCEKSYTHINQLNAHKRIHMKAGKLRQDNKSSKEGSKGKGRTVHKCPICHALFYNYKKFCGHRGAHIAHKMTHFGKRGGQSQKGNGKESSQHKPKVVESKGTESPSAGLKKLAGKFTCKFCPDTFMSVAQLRNHIMASHPITKGKPFLLKPFTCELCGSSFTKSKQRQLHMRLHAKRRRRRVKRTISLQDSDHSYYKKLPSQRGNTASEAETHKLQMKGGESKTSKEVAKKKAFKCRVCDKSFKTQHQMAGHMHVHKRYPCQLCPASFTLARQLCGHLKVHGGLQKKVGKESPSLDGGHQSSEFNGSQSSALCMASQQEIRSTASSLSSVLLRRVINVFLTGLKSKKRRIKWKAGKWLQPKGSLKRAQVKYQQTLRQNIIGILRKCIILEIDADSHRPIYECKGCQKIAYCHKNILRHFLEKHLSSREGTKDVLQVAITGREDALLAPNPRFRNKSKIGCPICKGSSGFQCHLHNEDELIAMDAFLRHDDDQEVLDSCDEGFTSHSELVHNRGDHAKRQPGEPFSCSKCPFQANSIHALMNHQKFHSEKREEEIPKKAPDEKLISCPHCSFKVKTVFGLAAHSRVHKNKGQKRALEDDRRSPAASSPPSPSLSLDISPENAQTSSDGVKHRKNAYNCFACPKYFYNLKAYQKHMKSHEQLFQFKCSVCSFSFLSVRMLDDHIKSVHSVKQPYTCSEFSSQSFEDMQSRIQVHSGTKEKKERQANWSAYLKAVLHIKGPEPPSVTPDESLTNSSPRRSGVVNYDSRAQAPGDLERYWTATNLHPEQAEIRKTTHSVNEDPVARKAISAMDNNTLEKPAEGSPHQQSDSPDEYFACSQCKDFRACTKGEWDNHIAIVHNSGSGPRKLKCSMCQYTTVSQERLDQHMRLHRHQTLQCNSCAYRTPMRHLMIRHVQTVHRQHRPFQCKLCTYATAYRHHLRRHAEKHKNPNFRCRYRKLMTKGDWQTAEASNHVICKICGRELQNKKTLRNHCIKVHNKIPGGKNQPYVQNDSGSDEIKATTKYQPSYSVVVEGASPTQIEKTYDCSVCLVKFKRRSELNQHMAQGHVEVQASLPCQCPQCGLVTGSGQLERHMLIHQEDNLLQCEEEGCHFKTAQAVHLQRHQNKHAAERDVRMTCRYCQVKFPDASSLGIHNAQVHSEQTNTVGTRSPFLCSICPFISTNEKDANRHFKLHNYNLAFKCQYCVFSSSTASAIATHQKIHRHPRRNSYTTLVSKKASQQQRQKITSSTSAKSGDGLATSAIPQRPRPKHVFVSNKGKKLYECRYCQRFFDVAEAWQRHELRHMAEWPQY